MVYKVSPAEIMDDVWKHFIELNERAYDSSPQPYKKKYNEVLETASKVLNSFWFKTHPDALDMKDIKMYMRTGLERPPLNYFFSVSMGISIKNIKLDNNPTHLEDARTDEKKGQKCHYGIYLGHETEDSMELLYLSVGIIEGLLFTLYGRNAQVDPELKYGSHEMEAVVYPHKYQKTK